MKALITVIDDNGKVICKDQVLKPFKEEIVDLNHGLPIKETRFSFIITQLADFQLADFQELEEKMASNNIFENMTDEEQLNL